MNLEEVTKAFPIGSQVSFLCDNGESNSEWRKLGIVQEYIPTYFGKDVLGYFSMKLYNSKTKKFHEAHVGNSELCKEYIRNKSLSSLLDE